MGVDWFDLTFRLEREFAIKLDKSFSEAFTFQRTQGGRKRFTAGDVLDLVVTALDEQARPVPSSAWNRVKRCLVHTSGVSPGSIRKGSRLIEDLGFS